MKKSIIAFIGMVILLVGCSVSENDAIDQTYTSVKETFSSQVNETNKTSDDLTYFLPNSLTIESEEEHNIVLNKGSQRFILFYNQLEDLSSEEVYKGSLSEDRKPVLNETFQEGNKFQYVIVYLIDNTKKYELIIGMGGVKITTETTSNKMDEDAVLMAQIIDSIQY